MYADSHGRAGGLALLWDKSVTLTLCSYSAHHMDAYVRWGETDEEWCFTGIYGWPKT